MSEHYFEEQPTAADVRTQMPAFIAGHEVQVTTSNGIFSHSGVDRGTRVLLDQIAELKTRSGTLLDLGCGWGPISLTLAIQAPEADVWAVDINQRAVELTAINAEHLDLKNVHAHVPDDVPADLRFDEIWSNPPIRIGKPALHDLLLRWLSRLSDSGAAYLVVQRNLGSDSLHTWLQESGFPTERVTSVKGFRVLRVQRESPRR